MSVLVVGAPVATANVPRAVSKINTVRIPAMGNLADGTLTTTMTYTTTAATAATSTGNTIGLGRGWLLRLRTCVAYHLNAAGPASNCAERDVDTRSNAGTIYTYAPSVTLAAQPRPTTQPWGYFTAYTEVLTPLIARIRVRSEQRANDRTVAT